MNPKVTIIADDLTGALDVAGPFASRGHPTWVVVDEARCEPSRVRRAQVTSINSASRHLSAASAADCVQGIARRLCAPDVQILIKKIDSTLRGNVVAETLAVMDATGRPNAVVAPAFPAQGRTVTDGVVFVKGVPLLETSFARDALSPPPRQLLEEVFRTADLQATVERTSPGGPFDLASRGRKKRVFVVDGRTEEDLRQTVRALSTRLADCVLVGSAGIAGAVAELCMPAGPTRSPPHTTGQVLVAVGSRAEQSVQQVTALSREPDARVYEAPDGRLEAVALQSADTPTIVLRATPGVGGRQANAEEVASSLASHVAQLLRTRPVGALVATGGDTAIAILQALAQSALEVMGDLLPGIPYCRMEVDGRPVWLVTKAGGFGTRQTLTEIVHLLRGAY